MFNGILFQESLQDLVKGIRAHRRDEEEYIRSKISEIGEECRSADMAKKTTAALKLTHVCMLHISATLMQQRRFVDTLTFVRFGTLFAVALTLNLRVAATNDGL